MPFSRGGTAVNGDAGSSGYPLISHTERLLCASVAAGSLDRLLPRSADAWTMQLPGLDIFAGQGETTEPIRICIATDQITGPVRNGGIGNTYAALALLLAEAGFAVTVLYLRGQLSEVETIDHWIGHYAKRAVALVPVPDYAAADRFASNAERWLRGPYNMMRYLIEHPMDVVHVSEWRGSGYLCLLAKRQGIAFANTLFVVKTSSPWMWNRLYGSHALDKAEDLVKIHAERCSVELADVVVGGSLHLLRWMVSQGYALPRDRAFVQPNVVTFTALQPLIKRRALPHGQRTPIDEFVFFGRLESRKGLFVFCQAIRRLIRKGVTLPARITFMGKPGSRLPSHPDQDTPDYIRETSRDWPTEVQILTGFQQYEAVEYLLSGKRLAVMPSIIENSSLAIYEAAICAIPTVATNVGGNAELIAAADHAAVLCEPHPVSLGDKLEEALALGGMVPTPSFDNDANLETWRSFHRQLRGDLRERLLDANRPPVVEPDRLPAISVVVYYLGDAALLEATVANLAGTTPLPHEVVVGVDATSNSDRDVAARMLEKYGFAAIVVDAFDLDAGSAFNRMAERATGEHLLFLWEGAQLEPGALGQLGAIARSTGAHVLNYLYREVVPGEKRRQQLWGQLLVGVADSFYRTDKRELPLFVDRATFLRLGGFTEDYRVLGYDHEFVAKAQLAGVHCETAMRELGSIQARSADWLRLRGYDVSASGFRVIRPQLAATPLGLRDTLLLARGMHARGVTAAKAKANGDSPMSPEGLLARMMVGLKQDGARPKPESPVRKPTKTDGLKIRAKAPAAAVGATTRKLGAASISSASLAIERETARALRQIAVRPYPGVGAVASESSTGCREPPMSGTLKTLLAAHAAVSEDDRVGQLLGAHGNQLYGWATRLADPDETLEVELVVDGSRHARQLQKADRLFAPFAVLPKEAARRGFVIDLPIVPGRDKGGIAYAVAVCACDLILGEGLVLPQDATLGACGIDAGCEPGEAGVIRGWARALADPVCRLDVAMFANGVFMGRCRANQPRPNGDCGFAMPVPNVLRKAGRHRIDVMIADLGLMLPGMPLWVEGALVAITPARARRRSAA